MAKTPGLVLRGTTYYSRVLVPKDLVARMGRRQIWKSLGTSERDRAEALHLSEAANWKAAFVEARSHRNKASAETTAAKLSSADAARLARQFFEQARGALDFRSTGPAELSDEEREATEADLQRQLSTLRTWRDPEAHRLVKEASDIALAGTGLAWSGSAHTDQNFSELIRRALMQLCSLELARLVGDYRDRPSDSFFTAPAGPGVRRDVPDTGGGGPSLGGCIDRFLAEVLKLRAVTDKTSLKHASLLAHIGAFFGRDTAVGSITRADCNGFRDTLSKLPPMGEILQLTPGHVRQSSQGTNFIVLTRDMMLKTDSAEREIPVHPTLERLGFLEWVAERRRANAVDLFDDVPVSKHGYRSDTFTKRFATFLRKIDLPPQRKSKLCFHSFRHTFKDALNETGVTEEVKDEICGWSRAKKTGRRYGTGLSADRLKPFLDQVTFEIDLSHLT